MHTVCGGGKVRVLPKKGTKVDSPAWLWRYRLIAVGNNLAQVLVWRGRVYAKRVGNAQDMVNRSVERQRVDQVHHRNWNSFCDLRIGCTAGTKRGLVKPKDLMMMPARVAMARAYRLTAGGCVRRSCGTSRTLCQRAARTGPRRHTRRCSCVTKKPRYFYDADAVREPELSKHVTLAARLAARMF